MSHNACALAATAVLCVLSPACLAAESAKGDAPIPRDLVRSRLPNIAVATLESRGVNAEEVGVIADNLASKLQQSGKFRVMERSQMQQILKEQSFQQSGACDQGQCAVEMAKLLGIDRIMIGSVGKVGSTYSLSLRLVDVATGEALRSSARTRKGSIDEVLTELVPEAVADFTDGAVVSQTASSGTAAPSESSESKGGSWWPWIAGGAVVAGGATAAILLTGSKSSSTPVESPTSSTGTDNHLKFTW